MSTEHPDLFNSLAAPFDPQEVRSRAQGGRQVQYVTARTVMNRLDTVLGPENWWDEYVPGENSVVCRLTIRIPDGEADQSKGWMTLTKSDAGGYAGMPDSGDDEKSGFSDAFKRAAVKFGVGRYLYRDGVAAHGDHPPDQPAAPVQPASRPNQAPPDHSRSDRPANGGHKEGNGGGDKAPRSGRGLFAWTKEQEQRHKVDLLKYLNDWAKLQDFPGRMIDWDADQVAMAHAEACRKLQSVSSG